jgi:alcohol dehydrogenase (cytochrome c)
VHAQDNYAQVFFKSKTQYQAGQGYESGGTRNVPGTEPYGGVKAIEATTGNVKWEFKEQTSSNSGILTTAGGLLFAGTRDGYFYALNAATGETLWNFQTGGSIQGGPVTFLIDGKQYVAIAAGAGLFAFGL